MTRDNLEAAVASAALTAESSASCLEGVREKNQASTTRFCLPFRSRPVACPTGQIHAINSPPESQASVTNSIRPSPKHFGQMCSVLRSTGMVVSHLQYYIRNYLRFEPSVSKLYTSTLITYGLLFVRLMLGGPAT